MKRSAPISLLSRTWTTHEELSLYKGVQIHGMGKWALIAADKSLHLSHKSGCKLKDKWRTMVKQGRLKELRQMHDEIMDSELDNEIYNDI